MTAKKLERFEALSGLQGIQRLPVRSQNKRVQPPAQMAEFMGNIFRSETDNALEFDVAALGRVQKVSERELELALQQMARGKAKDKAGVALEMVAEAGEEAHSCLIKLYNTMLDSGQFPEE